MLWNLSPGGLYGRQHWAGKREHSLSANLLLQLCSFGWSLASCKVILFGHQVEIKTTDQRPHLRERYNIAFCDIPGLSPAHSTAGHFDVIWWSPAFVKADG